MTISINPSRGQHISTYGSGAIILGNLIALFYPKFGVLERKGVAVARKKLIHYDISVEANQEKQDDYIMAIFLVSSS